ncbi:MAG: CarD family transcriptional regulator, partial [bacterium]
AIVAPIAALMQAVPEASRLDGLVRRLSVGARVDPTKLVAWLVEGGYRRVDAIESPGEVAVRGGIVDIFPPGGEAPVRLDLFGDEIERIFEIDIATQASDRKLEEIELVAVALDAVLGDARTGAGAQPMVEMLPEGTITVLAEMSEIVEQARAYWDRVRDGRGVYGPPATLSVLAKHSRAVLELHAFGSAGGHAVRLGARALPVFDEDAASAAAQLVALAEERRTFVPCGSDGERSRMTELLARHGSVETFTRPVMPLTRGFLLEKRARDGGAEGDAEPDAEPDAGGREDHAGGNASAGATARANTVLIAPAAEVLHRNPVRRRGRSLAGGRAKDAFLTFEPGDYVVHRDHGIARFVGLQTLAQESALQGTIEQEFLTLEFDQGAKIHVPASRIELVQRYVGAGSVRPKLSTLGGKRWKRAKEEAEESARDFAGEMLRVQAARAATPGIAFPADGDWQREFESQFPYEETEDQLSAIASTKRDMERARPMDRLVCGDVGFGKTEIAIRAAFKAVDA